MTPKEALDRLARDGEDMPVGWWLSGPDAYFGERIVAGVRRRLGDTVEHRRVDGRADPMELGLWLSTQSFLGDPRLLVWRDVDGRVAAGRAMQSLWRAVGPRAGLVCWNDKPSSPPAGSPLVPVDLTPLRGAAWAALVRAAAEQRRILLTPGALALVAEASLPSGHVAEAVLDRLALMYPAGHVIGEAVVADHVPPTSSVGLLGLIAGVLQRDVRQALAELTRQLEQGTPPLVLLVAVSRQMMALHKVLAARAAGASDAEVRRAVDLRPWQWDQVRQAARHWTAPAVASWLERAAAVDQRLKRSVGSESVWLTGLVLSTAPASAEAPPR
ncbi:MAG: hypothetical protein M0Z54_02535 [Thermaerobacter sp.]|nr:hypothetical protein [Thermaerobacter sp.]